MSSRKRLRTSLKDFLLRCSSAEKSGNSRTKELPYGSVGCSRASERILLRSLKLRKQTKKGQGFAPGIARPVGALYDIGRGDIRKAPAVS